MERGEHELFSVVQFIDDADGGEISEYVGRALGASHHHHVAGTYLLRYAQESSWREDNRRVSNGDQVNRLAALAMSRKPSVDFSGYWQRHLS